MIPPHIIIEIMKNNQKYPMDISSKEAKFLMGMWIVALLLIIGLGINNYLYFKEKKEKSEAERIVRQTKYKAYLEKSQIFRNCLQNRINRLEQGLLLDESHQCIKPKSSY